METVKALLNDDPAMLLRESMGICADGSNKAFPSKDVDAWLQRVRLDVPEVHASEGKHFVLAVDPAGGGAATRGSPRALAHRDAVRGSGRGARRARARAAALRRDPTVKRGVRAARGAVLRVH